MTQIQQLRNYVAGSLAKLQAMPPHPKKAALANLRHGLGRAPGELPELWGFFFRDMPEAFVSPTGEPTKGEWAAYLALTLYAMHQQGQAQPMHRAGAGLGRAARRLVPPQEDPAESSVMKRFNALATASGMGEISHHLRGIIQMLRAQGIPLDYEQLAADLFEMQFPQSMPRVRLRWGQDFYANPKQETPEEQQQAPHPIEKGE